VTMLTRNSENGGIFRQTDLNPPLVLVASKVVSSLGYEMNPIIFQ